MSTLNPHQTNSEVEFFFPNSKLNFVHSDYPHLLRCQESGLIYNVKKPSKQTVYESKYFMEEYKDQYGLNYIEEEENHRRRAKSILSLLRKHTQAQQKKLLEIGCATGFFIHEAQKSGYSVEGIEVSNFASNYAREIFHLPVRSDAFPDVKLKTEHYDIIAFFYVLEHLYKQPTALDTMLTALKPNGLLVFTLPSTFGPLYYYHLREWLNHHPSDHFVDYNPVGLTKIFSQKKLQILELTPAAYHPERFIININQIPWRWIYNPISKKLCFGDTLIGIARKTVS